MNTAKVSLVPLQHASLCLDCDMITGAHTQCFACGSGALLNLARILNGQESSRPMRAVFAAVTMRARSEGYAADMVSARERRLSGHFDGEVMRYPKAGLESSEGQKRSEHRLWRSPLRGVAAMVHRSMTVALLAVSILSLNVRAQATACTDGQSIAVPHVISDRARKHGITTPRHR